MEVRVDLAKEAIAREICAKSSLTMDEAACGILSVVNANMMRAIRLRLRRARI